MKKLLTAVLLLLPIFKVEAQPALWWGASTITTNTNGGPIVKNDTIVMEVKLNPNFSTIRSVFFDFQHQKDAIQLLGVERGAGIPANASFTYTNNYYPNCKFNRTAQNTTNNGYTNYMYAGYTCNASTVPYHAINRIQVNVSSATNLEHATYMKLKFKITNTTAGFPYDSVYMNFAFGYDVNGGTMTTTENVGTKGVWIQFDPQANILVKGELKQSPNVSTATQGLMKLSITDTLAQPTEVANTGFGTNGAFSFAQQLQNNSNYRMRLVLPSANVAPLSLAATTISDFTAAQQEWITQNLDKTYKNNNITNGIKYWAADVNGDGVFDGGDVQILFNAVTGLDTIMTPPAQCGSGCNYSLPLFRTDEYDVVPMTNWQNVVVAKSVTVAPGDVEWAILNPNAYATNQSRLLVDVRQFPSGVNPNTINSVNILDIYNGPVTFMSNDGMWAMYKVPSNVSKVTNGSTYTVNIRNVNNSNTDYALKSTVIISDKNPGSVFARTTVSEQTVNLSYALKGDVNLSHSSAVTEQQAAIVMGNLVVPGAGSIDTKLNNVVVTGDTITIPFNIDTKGILLSGLQYEVKFDPTLVKFVKMNIDTPSWVSFVHPMEDGTIRFGAVDKDLKNPLTGVNLTPFKLQFVAVKAGVDLNTSVVLTEVMDAADNKGNQVGINLSSTVIRLVGISNFR